MNPLITFRRTLQTTVLVAAALALSLPVLSLRAQPGMSGDDSPMGEHHGMISGQRGEMMAEHEKMLAEMKAGDTAIAELIAKLKSAPQTQKTDLLTEIVTRLAAQQAALHTGMEKMHQMMS